MGQDNETGAPRPTEGEVATVLLDAVGAGALAPTLEVAAGRAEPPTLRLTRARVTLGRRSANDLAIDDEAVSRAHAEVVWEEGRFVAVDLGSRNGVLVDKERVHERTPLAPGARLTLGTTELRFAAPDADQPGPRRAMLVEGCGLLAGLQGEQQAALARELRFFYVPEGGVVLRQGAPVTGMLFVADGELRVVDINDEGGERELSRLRPGAAWGELAMLPGQPSPHTLIADTEACVGELPREVIDRVLATSPESSQTVYLTVRERLRTGAIELDAAVPAGVPAPAAEAAEIVGEDRRLAAAREKVEEAAGKGRAVVVIGADGVGKRTLARHYHASRPGGGGAYAEVSLAEVAAGERGAALFGVEAEGDGGGRPGYLEMLDGGTLAIVHAELLDAHLQARLATYLERGWFHRMQGKESRQATTRVVLLASSGGDGREVSELLGEELREALKGAVVKLPTLAQRVKDIPLLADHFLTRFAAREGKRLAGFTPTAMEKLVSYAWPGNVSELENVIERVAIVAAPAGAVSEELVFVVPPEKDVHKLNLLRNEKLRQTLRHPLLFKAFTWLNIAFVAAVLAFTLYGGTRPPGHPLTLFENNFGMVVTWLVWFPLLPLSAVLVGRVWCGVCPIAGAGDLAERLAKLARPVPKILKRLDLWLLVGAFVVLDFSEELFGVADRPMATAVLLIVIVGLSMLFCVLYERKAFCRHLCPLAGMLGAYASLSALEVRGNKKVCQTQCGQHTCFKGAAEVPPCPLGSYPASLTSSIDCMMCGNCLKSCDNRGVQVNLRPPLSELWRQGNPALAMSVFAVVLVALMARHQLPMLTVWQRAQQSLGWTEAGTHVVLWSVFVGLSLVAFALAATLSAGASQEGVRDNAARFGLAFIPLAFSGHLAHIAHEWLGEGAAELAAYGVKLFDAAFRGVSMGSRDVAVALVAAPPVVTFIKLMLVCGGAIGSAVALVMIARRAGRWNLGPRLLPYALLLLFFWIGYLLIFTGSTAELAATVTAMR